MTDGEQKLRPYVPLHAGATTPAAPADDSLVLPRLPRVGPIEFVARSVYIGWTKSGFAIGQQLDKMRAHGVAIPPVPWFANEATRHRVWVAPLVRTSVSASLAVSNSPCHAT
jgi:hypothetical protein